MAYRVLILALLSACQVTLPEVIRCPGQGPCPDGLVCNAADLCVESLEDDAGGPDAGTDVSDDDAPALDAPALDAPAVDVYDAGPPDADAGPPPPDFVGGLVFGGSGDDTVSSVAVVGDILYVAGTTTSPVLQIPGCSASGSSGSDADMYIAKIDVSTDVPACEWAFRFSGDRVTVKEVAATADGVFIGGDFRGTFLETTSPQGADGASGYLLQLRPDGTELGRHMFLTNENDFITGLSALGDFFCATVVVGTMIRGGVLEEEGLSDSNDLDGVLICFEGRSGNPVGFVPLFDERAYDVALTAPGRGQFAWRTAIDGVVTATAMPFTVTTENVALREGRATGFGLPNDSGRAIASDGDGGVVMAVGFAENTLRVGSPRSPAEGPLWEYLGMASDVEISGMLAFNGRLHIVGEYSNGANPPEQLLFDGLPAPEGSGAAFHASFVIGAGNEATVRNGGADDVRIGDIVPLGDRLVLAGTLRDGDTSFPGELSAAEGWDGFIYAFVPED